MRLLKRLLFEVKKANSVSFGIWHMLGFFFLTPLKKKNDWVECYFCDATSSPMSRVVAFCLLLASLTHASSFATNSVLVAPSARVRQRSTLPSTVASIGLLRVRGGSATIVPPHTTTAVMSASGGAKAADPAAKNKKMRISAFDSMRFFLIFNIVLGHFISFAKPSPLVLKLFSQHNVLVGAFFALSGYVTVSARGGYSHRLWI
jgi:hypothetical protein